LLRVPVDFVFELGVLALRVFELRVFELRVLEPLLFLVEALLFDFRSDPPDFASPAGRAAC